MGGFLGIGGASWKADRDTERSGFSDLKNVFNFGMDTSKGQLAAGKATTSQGLEDLGGAAGYFKRLMSGDRAEAQQAVAPETNAVAEQADATRRQQAEAGTARGGGTAGANQTAHDTEMAKIDNLLFGARPAAAQQVAQIGGKEADIGQSELGQAMQALGISSNAAAERTEIARRSRTDSYKINQDIVGQWKDTIAALAAMA